MLITDLLAAPLITHQDRRDAGLPVHHSHLTKIFHPDYPDHPHLLPQLGELEHALLVQLDPLLKNSKKHLTHIKSLKSSKWEQAA